MMKERILQIMRQEHMTQQEFAKAIEVSPASLSNIFNGKTNPTNNHVSAIHRRFPNVNVNWLMFGDGDMYTTVSGETKRDDGGAADSFPMGADPDGNDGGDAPALVDVSDSRLYADWPRMESMARECEEKMASPKVREVIKFVDKPQRRITEIRIFFDDGTFEVFSR